MTPRKYLSEEEKTRFQQDLNKLLRSYGFDCGYAVGLEENSHFAVVIVSEPVHPEVNDLALLTLDLMQADGARRSPRINDN